MRRAAFRRDAGGYVLIFVAGVLLFISVVVLGMAHSLRLDAQLTRHETQRLRHEYLLRSGLQYLVAQLRLHAAVTQAGAAIDVKERESLRLWLPDQGPYEVTLKAGGVRVFLEDAGTLPDANQLTLIEWERLLGALAGGNGGRARAWAQRVIEIKADLAARRGGSGFETLDDLLAIAELPEEVRFGKAGQPASGLQHLLNVGTGLKQLEVHRSPLLLFRVLTDATPEQLQQVEQARLARRMSLAEANRILGQSKVTLFEGASPVLRARIVRPESGGAGIELIALLRLQNGVPALISQRLAYPS